MKLALVRAAALCALAAVTGASTASAQTAGNLVRANVGASGLESEGIAGEGAVSADGRFVAFTSDADDLVSSDTNGDTDVFVRDRSTDVLQRVSVASNGMEARGDSTCPALSADGRYVAFLSNAVNLAPAGTGLVPQIVYVHDRRDGSTSAISVTPEGGRPDRASHCPSISDDGQRIAFASEASNLIAGDDNNRRDVFLRDRASGTTTRLSESASGGDTAAPSGQPRISGDGRFVTFESYAADLVPNSGLPLSERTLVKFAPHVYVRDVESGETELVSVAVGHPLEVANGVSIAPSISRDGRYVAFLSVAKNLVSPPPTEYDNVYVRDRVAGTTWLASPADPLQTDCGRPGVQLHCKQGSKGRPAISADGRFVTFSSRSLFHLPANQWSGDQIYLFDNLSRRLRRLSVDATGAEGEACSWDPALSADGRVLAWASKSANLVPDDAGLDADVYAQERSCDAAGVCRPLAACPAKPLDCAAAESSLLRLSKRPPGGIGQDDLYWRWSGAAGDAAFPDPSAGASYQACVYADGVALDVAAPPAARCAGSDRPCWRQFASGYKLLDPAGGLTSVVLTRSDDTRRIRVEGSGTLLDAPYLPLEGAKGIVVQLHETSSGQCWGASFPASAIRRNTAGVAAPGSRRDGLLIAEIR